MAASAARIRSDRVQWFTSHQRALRNQLANDGYKVETPSPHTRIAL